VTPFFIHWMISFLENVSGWIDDDMQIAFAGRADVSTPSSRSAQKSLSLPKVLISHGMVCYAPLIVKRLSWLRQPLCGSVRIDETYVKVCSKWRYLHSAIDKHGL
jgi:hypothetical protein